MTDEQRNEEGAEEAIEDLEAPAAAQEDVAGGKIPETYCRAPTEPTPQCNDKVTCKITRVLQ